MKKIFALMLTIVFMTGALTITPVIATEAPSATVINPVADTWTNGTKADVNYGSEKYSAIRISDRYFFLKFPISEIRTNLSENVEIDSAVITLYATGNDAKGNADATESDVLSQIYYVDNDTWEETSLTHNTKPGYGDAISGKVTIPTGTQYDSGNGNFTFNYDITTAVKAEIAKTSDDYLSCVLNGDSSDYVNQNVGFFTKDTTVIECIPKLTVTYKLNSSAPDDGGNDDNDDNDDDNTTIQTTAIYTDADTYVDGNSDSVSSLNYGIANYTLLKSGANRHPLFKFSISDLRENLSGATDIESAKLTLYVIGSDKNGTATNNAIGTTLYYVEDDTWEEGSNGNAGGAGGVTYTDMPQMGSEISNEVEIPAGTTYTSGEFSFTYDITDAVKAEVADNSDSYFSCALSDDGTNQNVYFFSDENPTEDRAYRPVLIVKYRASSSTPDGGDNGDNGDNAGSSDNGDDWDADNENRVELKAELVADAAVDNGNPTYNYGGSKLIRLKGGSRYTYFKFNISNLREPLDNYEIKNAVLRVYVQNDDRTLDIKSGAYYVEDDAWKEGNKNGTEETGDALKWENRPLQGALISDETLIAKGTPKGTPVSYDITEAVKNEVENNDTEFSCMLDFIEYANNNVLFYTKESTDNGGAYIPQLIVTYTPRKIGIKSFEVKKNNTFVDSITGGELSVSVNLKNTLKTSKTVSVLCALYNKAAGDKMVSIQVKKDIVVSPGLTPIPMDNTFLVPTEGYENYYIKAFVTTDVSNTFNCISSRMFDVNGASAGEKAKKESNIAANVSYDSQTLEVLAKGQSNGFVSVVVLPSGVSPENLTQENISSNLSYFNTIKLDAVGTKIFLKDTAPQGIHNAYFFADGITAPVKVPFSYYPESVVLDNMALLNGKADADAVKSFLETNGDKLLLDMTDYNTLTDVSENNEKLFVAKYIYDYKTTNGNFTEYGKIKELFDYATGIKMFNHLTSADFLTVVEKYDDILGLDANLVSVYKSDAISQKVKSDFFTAVSAQSYDTAQKVCDTFKNKLISIAMSSSEKPYDISQFMNVTFNGYFTLDNSYYNLVELKNEVYRKMMDYMPFASVNAVENAFYNASKAQHTEENTPSDTDKGSSGGGGGGGKTIVMPSVPVEIPQEIALTDCVFADVPENHWAKDSIEKLAKRGIVSGNENGDYMPDNNISRAELVKIITVGFAVAGEGEIPFDDISKSSWYYPYIKVAYAAQIINGISESEFGADQKITRQDLAVILHRIMKNKGYTFKENGRTLSDESQISDYAREAVKGLYNRGIINGISEGVFAPTQYATRAQVAVLVNAVLEMEENAE